MPFVLRLAALITALSASAALPATAAQHVANPQERAALMLPINAYFSAATAGNVKLFHAQYAASSTIIDEFAPFEWTGVNAQDRYFADFGKTLTVLKMTDPKLLPGASTYSYVDGARGYVILPVKVTAKIGGKPYAESGWMAFTLVQSTGAWKIAVQCWAKGPESFNPY